MPQYINIVHLSDLHLKKKGAERFNQSQIIDALSSDLAVLSSGPFRADLIVFSGDLANSADDIVYDEILDALGKLAKSANLPVDRIIVTPGNHDAHQKVARKELGIIKRARAQCNDITDVNKLYFDQEFVPYVGRLFSGFSKLSSKVGPTPRRSDAFGNLYVLDALKIGVVTINTATLTFAGLPGEDRDEGRLAFSEVGLVEMLRLVPEGYTRLVVGHHPLEVLSEASSKAIKAILLKEADIYAFGHMHAAEPTHVQSPAGQCTMIQAGALYASRDWWNGYSVISAVAGARHHRMHLRKWHEARREFGIASELDDQGLVYFSDESREFWATIEPRLDLQALDRWRVSQLQPSLERECNQTLTDQTLDNVYVDPEFERDVYVETEEGKQLRHKPDTVELNSILWSSENIIVAAPPESGKTALTRHWASELAKTSTSVPSWSVPVILDFGNLKTYTGGIEAAVKRRLPDLPQGLTPSALLNAGLVTILVDDLKLEEGPVKDALSGFIEKFPHCRYVFLTSTPFLQGAGITPVLASVVPFTVLRLKGLKKSHFLELIEKHGTTDPKQADKLLQRMLLEANALSVPITPVSGTFLIQIFTEDASKPLVNRASLVERYVEISLEKFGKDDFLAGTFDFHNKADLLSDIAERMCRTGVYELPEAEFIMWIKGYLDEFGLKYSELDLLGYFVESRILERVNSCVAFRLRAFMEYFAARRMESDTSFRDFVLHPVRYLSHPNEISFYAAISRRDQGWMEELFSRFALNSDFVWSNVPKEVREGTLLDNFTIPGSDATESEVLAVERRILDADLTDQGRRELLSSESSVEDKAHKRVYRPATNAPEDSWIEQLSLLSAMLKNMELVRNPVKTRILEAVIRAWVQFICLSLGLVPGLAKEKSLTLSGVKYEVHFPDNAEIGEIARRLFISMPISIVKMAHQHLGTEKLQLQLEEGLGEPVDKVSAAEQFVRVGLLSLLGTEGVAEKLRITAERLQGRKYLSEVLLRQMYELAVRFRLPDHELREVRRLAASVATLLEGTPASEVGKRKSQIIENLTKSRLVVGIDPETREGVKRLKGTRS